MIISSRTSASVTNTKTLLNVNYKGVIDMNHTTCVKHGIAKATIYQNERFPDEVWDDYMDKCEEDFYHYACPLCTYLYELRETTNRYWCVCNACPLSDKHPHDLCNLFVDSNDGQKLDKSERDKLFSRIRTALRTWTKKQLMENIARMNQKES